MFSQCCLPHWLLHFPPSLLHRSQISNGRDSMENSSVDSSNNVWLWVSTHSHLLPEEASVRLLHKSPIYEYSRIPLIISSLIFIIKRTTKYMCSDILYVLSGHKGINRNYKNIYIFHCHLSTTHQQLKWWVLNSNLPGRNIFLKNHKVEWVWRCELLGNCVKLQKKITATSEIITWDAR